MTSTKKVLRPVINPLMRGSMDSSKRKQGGPPELVINGGFDTNSDWSGVGINGYTITGGVLNVVAPNTGNPSVSQAVPMVTLTQYRLKFDWTRTAGRIQMRAGGGTTVFNEQTGSSGSEDILVTAEGASLTIVSINGTFSGTFDNISIKAA
mgnify:CR=1 FL=1